MYAVYLAPLGEVVLHLSSIRFSGRLVYISGYDRERNRIEFTMDKIRYPDNRPEECGYCHILSYAMHENTVSCNEYKALY